MERYYRLLIAVEIRLRWEGFATLADEIRDELDQITPYERDPDKYAQSLGILVARVESVRAFCQEMGLTKIEDWLIQDVDKACRRADKPSASIN